MKSHIVGARTPGAEHDSCLKGKIQQVRKGRGFQLTIPILFYRIDTFHIQL